MFCPQLLTQSMLNTSMTLRDPVYLIMFSNMFTMSGPCGGLARLADTADALRARAPSRRKTEGRFAGGSLGGNGGLPVVLVVFAGGSLGGNGGLPVALVVPVVLVVLLPWDGKEKRKENISKLYYYILSNVITRDFFEKKISAKFSSKDSEVAAKKYSH
jgi:hypothetical protein